MTQRSITERDWKGDDYCMVWDIKTDLEEMR
jgi:hypothetical protein